MGARAGARMRPAPWQLVDLARDHVWQVPILKWALDQTIDLDRTVRALADSSRRSMVERLSAGPASVSQLAEPLSMSLAAVVQHVQVLEACGLVSTEKVGRTRMCRIERAAMTAAEQWISERRRGWETRLDRLGDVLADPAIGTGPATAGGRP